MLEILENVEHCGGKPEQADTARSPAKLKWVPGEGFYFLCVVCPLVLQCQGKACLSTCCLSLVSQAIPFAGEGM